MKFHIEQIDTLLLVAALVAIVSRRCRFPYTAGLLTTGFMLSFLPIAQPVTLAKELRFSALQHIMFWDGLRGALALALSVKVQDQTMRPLLRWLKLLPNSAPPDPVMAEDKK